MTNNTFAKFLMAGVAIVSLSAVASAQTSTSGGGGGSTANGTVASSATAKTASDASPAAPTGPVKSALPLAAKSVFEAAEKAAAASTVSGAPGVSEGGSNQSAPMAYGSSTAPYTTARVAVTTLGTSTWAAGTPVTSYPYRATGKLYFKIGSDTYVCTASLVKRGVLITAAHCVFNYGQKTSGWYSNWTFCPANTSSSGGVYGCYSGLSARILTPYYNGTDVCTQSGVVCNNDLATIVLSPKNNVQAGAALGWYAYGWNGYSYSPTSLFGNSISAPQITQLGYPVAFDNGYQMERTDAIGWYYTSGNLKNTQIGSAQTGGSSGGPWLVNFGTTPTITGSASLGTATVQAVVGVTSYGSTTVGYNRQGASFFGQNTAYPDAAYGSYGAGNIGKLMNDTCTAAPWAC